MLLTLSNVGGGCAASQNGGVLTLPVFNRGLSENWKYFRNVIKENTLLRVNIQSSISNFYHHLYFLTLICVTIFCSYLSEPRDILLPELLSLSLSTLSGEVRDEEKLESRAEENAPELRLLRPPYPLSLNIELEAVLEWNDINKHSFDQ